MSEQDTNPDEAVVPSLLSVYQSAIERCPLPMAVTEGFDHILRCINSPLCRLVGKGFDELLGQPACDAIPAGKEFFYSLHDVYSKGENRMQSGKPVDDVSSEFAAYAMWPTSANGHSKFGVMIQFLGSGTASVYSDEAAASQTPSQVPVHREPTPDELRERLRIEVEERNKALEALVKAEKLASLGRMAASIAHEINNPLETVTNLVYLTRGMADLPENARQFLDIADTELSRIGQITRQTLGFYRESPAAEPFSVASLVDSVLHLLVAKIKANHAAVDCDIAENLEITAHFGEMRQVICNLLLNSLDAAGAGGKVRLRARMRSGPADSNGESAQRRVWITICDGGTGIDAHALTKIFDPFFTTKGSVGNGLGLWVSREIVNKSGGEIRVRSATAGSRKGTTFAVILPAVPR